MQKEINLLCIYELLLNIFLSVRFFFFCIGCLLMLLFVSKISNIIYDLPQSKAKTRNVWNNKKSKKHIVRKKAEEKKGINTKTDSKIILMDVSSFSVILIFSNHICFISFFFFLRFDENTKFRKIYLHRVYLLYLVAIRLGLAYRFTNFKCSAKSIFHKINNCNICVNDFSLHLISNQ